MYQKQKYDSVKFDFSKEDLNNLKFLIKYNTERLGDSEEDDVLRKRNEKLLITLETYGHADRETYIFKNELQMLFWVLYEEAICFANKAYDLEELVNDYENEICKYRNKVTAKGSEFDDGEENGDSIFGQ